MSDAPKLTAREMSADVLELECPQIVWKNLIFLRTGRTLFGFNTFASEAAARQGIAEAVVLFAKWLARSRNWRIVDTNTGQFLYYVRDYLHAIPVQVYDR